MQCSRSSSLSCGSSHDDYMSFFLIIAPLRETKEVKEYHSAFALILEDSMKESNSVIVKLI